jgi:hypothetical protein
MKGINSMTLAEKARHSLEAAWGYAMANLIWYGLMAGAVWLVFYVLGREPAGVKSSPASRPWDSRAGKLPIL